MTRNVYDTNPRFTKGSAIAALAAAIGLSALLGASPAIAQPNEGRKTKAPDRTAVPPDPPTDVNERPKNVHGKPEKKKNVTGADVADRYIVKLKPGRNPHQVSQGVGASPKHVYENAIRGFAGRLNRGQLNALQRHGDVELIEPDQIVQTQIDQPMNAAGQPWGLDRIDQSSRPLDGNYTYFTYGTGVRVYIIDTGIQRAHPDLASNGVLNVYDAFGGNGEDCNGHGTHVAGIVGGTTYGVAKRVYLRGVRVIGCTGSGTWSDVIAGMDWVARNHTKPAVANLSLAGVRSLIVNTAVENLVKSGVYVTVAAGNFGGNSCNYSPASAPLAYAVAASTRADAHASLSNHGTCVDGYAPGVDILSSWLASGTRILTGTSMASPHVAGTAALYKAYYGDASAETITAYLNASATMGVLSGVPTGSPNRLVKQPF